MTAFRDSLDIANRALDHLGLPHILAVNEDTLRNNTMANAYDKLREAELERNVWKFAKRKVFLRPVTSTTRLLAPQPWNGLETYLPGAVVSDANGDLWISWRAENIGNIPGVSTAWDSYYGPMAIDVWQTGVGYNAGELAYVANATGTFAVYLCMTSTNVATPNVAAAWSATSTYGLDDRVSYSGSNWRSLITLNLNLTPADAPSAYSATHTYASGNTVTASDGMIYTCVHNGTVGIDPTLDDGTNWTQGNAAAWSRSPAPFPSDQGWLPIYANLINVPSDSIYTAPNSIINSRVCNVFRCPAGYMRRARIGYRTYAYPDDYEPHGNYWTSEDAIMLLEFVANIRDVTEMDAMFCEGLALRLAETTCKKLTGSDAGIQNLVAEYNKFMNEARTVNGIEEGAEEPDEDEYLTVRTGGPGGFTSGATNWWN